MAFGSVTAPSRTKADTRTSSTSRARSSSASGRRAQVPVASTSRARLIRSSGESEAGSESDFDRDARREAREVKAEAHYKKEVAKWNARRKECRERGEELPPDIKRPVMGDVQKKGGKVRLRQDETAVVALARRKQQQDGKGKGKAVARAYGASSDADPLRATKPTLRRSAKRKEVEARTGLRIVTGSGESSDEGAGANEVLALGGDLSDDEDEVRRHLARRWVDKQHPYRMSARRKALELKYNPLVTLLNIKITVVEGADRVADSEDEHRRTKNAAFPTMTDSESSLDWNTDGMGELNGMCDGAKSRPPPGRVKVEPSSPSFEAKTKPACGSADIVKPVDGGSQPALQPTALEEPDYESEPSTEDDEDDEVNGPLRPALPPTSTPSDIKPQACKPSTSSFSTAVAPAVPDQAKFSIDVGEDDVDTGDEPDTEPSDVEVNGPPSSLTPHFPAHTHTSSSSPIASAVKHVSQSQAYSSASQRLSQHSPASQMPMDVEGDTSEDDVFLRGYKAQADKKRREEEKQAAQRREAKQAQMAAERAQRREEELAQRVAEGRGEKEFDGGDDQDETDDDDVPMWESHAVRPEDRVEYPQPVRKGRPKFPLQNAQQAKTGPHVLTEGDSAKIPAPINRFLRQYQHEGVEFLYGQYKAGRGGILGDDMGLGKTIQVIAFLSAVMGKQGLRKFDAGKRKAAINERSHDEPPVEPTALGPTCLIICPASVVHNWEREFATWGYFDVGIFHGNTSEKESMLRHFDRGYVDVVITSVAGARNGIAELAQRDFSIVIVDEAHQVKNPTSKTTIALHEFKTPLRYGLTGTAIQNRLSEFWCILNWAVPGRVGTQSQWSDLVARPIKYAQKADATDEELALGRTRAYALVTSLLPHFWLRRTKESVKLQLPKKYDNVVLCPLTPLQQDVYRRLLRLDGVQVMLTADDPCPCGERDSEGLPYKRGSCCDQEWSKLIFKYITLFQKVSNHLALIYPNKEDRSSDPDKYEQDVEWAQAAFPDDWHKRKPGRTAFFDPDLCGKWNILCELLAHWHAQGDKVLIFSMSLKILDLLRDLMQTTNYQYLTLDGSTPQEDRMPLVDKFNERASEVFCFLISTRAGGVGLNLTAANRVVIFDPNWNPAHDLQAMDRAYRFGQTREVTVYRLIGAGTLEELIYNRQQYKRAIASAGYEASAERRLYTGVEGEGKTQAGELWGVKNIFRLNENMSLTEKSIRRADLSEIEYALRNSSVFEADDGKGEDLEEPDPEDVVAEVTGYGKKAGPDTRMTPEEAARHRQHLAEQERIAQILRGTARVESDATLGVSNIEMLRGRAAIQDHAQGKKASARATPSSAPPKPPARSKKRKAGAVHQQSTVDWNPLARGMPRLSPKKVKVEAAGDLFAQYGLAKDEPVADVIAASYPGPNGPQELTRALEAMGNDHARRRKKLEQLVRTFRERRRA